MAVSFGIRLAPQDSGTLVRWTRLAEQAGFGLVTTGDNPPLLRRDVYVGLTMMALNTTRCRIGPAVTNPITRSPVVTASVIASLNDLAPGRVFLGMGTGNATALNGPAATRREVEEYVRAVRDLWSHGWTKYGGQRLQIQWTCTPFPIFISATGKKGLQQAGRIADGVFVELGLLPELVSYALEQIAIGAKEAGRSAEGVEMWWYLKANLGTGAEQAGNQIMGDLARIALRSFATEQIRVSYSLKLSRQLELLQREYTKLEPLRYKSYDDWNEHLAKVVGQLELRDYLVGRYAIVGTSKDWVTRIRTLASLGVTRLMMGGHMPMSDALFSALGRDVMPETGQ